MVTKHSHKLKEGVIAFLRRNIRTREFKAGEHIKEIYVTQVLGVSRAPVREAFLELAAQGLLRLAPNRGAYVVELTAQKIMDRILLCGALEGFALRSTLHLFNPPDFKRLEDSVDRMTHIVESSGDISELLEEELFFHHACVVKVKDAFLLEFIEKCSRMLELLLAEDWKTIYTPEDFLHRHKTLYTAIAEDDPDLVEKCVREHYFETASRMAVFGVDVRKKGKIA